jgi:RNA polymerase sigma-70 factor (ECF subfamily)
VGEVTPPLRVLSEPEPAPADWETVYRNHVSSIYRFVYARTGNKPDAEDVTSTAFMRALPRLRADVSEAETRAYLRATARTVLADMWAQRHGVSADVIDEEAVSNPWTPEAPSVDVSGILERLPPHYRQVLELRFLRGYSIRETAAAMNISVSNAKVMQLRALRRAAGQREEAAS